MLEYHFPVKKSLLVGRGLGVIGLQQVLDSREVYHGEDDLEKITETDHRMSLQEFSAL